MQSQMAKSFQDCISIFFSCSNSLGNAQLLDTLIGPKRWCLEEKNHSDIGMRMTKNRKMSGSIVNNAQNGERNAIFQTALLHFAGVVIQEGILEEDLGHPDFSSIL